MHSRADVLSSCSSAAHTHMEGLRAPGSQASSPPHIKHTNCHWQEKPRRRNLTTQNMQSWPIFFSQRVFHIFLFFTMSSHWLRDGCGLDGPWSKSCGPVAPVMDRIISTFTWMKLNQTAYKHILYKHTWTVSAPPPPASIVGLAVDPLCWKRFGSLMYHCCQC